MNKCPICGADETHLHAYSCRRRPRRNIKIVSDPRSRVPIQVDPEVQAVREHMKNLMAVAAAALES